MRVFLSYAWEDREWSHRLASSLRRSGLQVWNSEAEIVPGENWALRAGRELERSQAMVILLSPAAAKSTAVQHELAYALASKRFRDRLIPVVVRPTHDVPWILTRFRPLKGEPAKVSKEIVKRLKGAGLASARQVRAASA